MRFFKLKFKSDNLKVVHQQTVKPTSNKSSEEKTLDEILDKINRSGYESLSKQEKETLQKIASKK